MEGYISKVQLASQIELVTLYNKKGWIVKVDTYQERELSSLIYGLQKAAEKRYFVVGSDLLESLVNICDYVTPVNPCGSKTS